MATRPGGYGGEDGWLGSSEAPAERELAFDTPDERLPWLESDDEGEEPGLVNAVLDKVGRAVRPEDFNKGSRAG